MPCEDLGWEAASVLEVHTLGWSGHGLVIPCEDLGWEAACGLRIEYLFINVTHVQRCPACSAYESQYKTNNPAVHTLGWSGHGLEIPCEDLGWEAACGLRPDIRLAQMGPRAELVSTKPHPQECLRAASHTIAGEATTTRIGLQETGVSVYNAVPRTSCGCYRRAEVLETHVCITRDRSVHRLSPAVRSQLEQRLHQTLIALEL